MTVFVTDPLGETFNIEDCTILCPRMGELDYGDPKAIILPDGETLMKIEDAKLHGFDGEPLEPEEIIDHLDG